MSIESIPTKEQIEARQLEIRRKRIATIVGCYNLLCEQFKDIKHSTTLNNPLVAETVEKYLSDRERFVARNNIQGRIQRHKVAGLMTAAIAKARPIYLMNEEGKSYRTSKENEFLAVMHGISICAEGNDQDAVLRMRGSKHFHIWFDDFLHLVKRHPDSADSFILIYETLCMNFFPEVLDEKKVVNL